MHVGTGGRAAGLPPHRLREHHVHCAANALGLGDDARRPCTQCWAVHRQLATDTERHTRPRGKAGGCHVAMAVVHVSCTWPSSCGTVRTCILTTGYMVEPWVLYSVCVCVCVCVQCVCVLYPCLLWHNGPCMSIATWCTVGVNIITADMTAPLVPCAPRAEASN